MSEILATSADQRFRVTLDFDEYAENPREWADVLTGALTFPDRNYRDVPEAGPLADEWRRLTDRYEYHSRGARADVAEIMARYIRVFRGGVSDILTPHDGPSALFYILPEMMASAGFTGDDVTSVERMTDALQAELQEYRSYVEGDVYVINVEELQTWQRVGHEDETRDDWETIHSLSQVIGREYAEQEAMRMLADEVKVIVRPASFAAGNLAATPITCPGCVRHIVVSDHGKTECGGEGEGACTVAIGDAEDGVSDQAHAAATRAHQRAAELAAPFLD